jgi:hypothetical protein
MCFLAWLTWAFAETKKHPRDFFTSGGANLHFDIISFYPGFRGESIRKRHLYSGLREACVKNSQIDKTGFLSIIHHEGDDGDKYPF